MWARRTFYRRVLGEEVLLGSLRVVTVSTSTSYMGQIRMYDDLRVTTTCERVGTKSMTLFQQLLVGDEVRSEPHGARRLRLRAAAERTGSRHLAGAAAGRIGAAPVNGRGGSSSFRPLSFTGTGCRGTPDAYRKG